MAQGASKETVWAIWAPAWPLAEGSICLHVLSEELGQEIFFLVLFKLLESVQVSDEISASLLSSSGAFPKDDLRSVALKVPSTQI